MKKILIISTTILILLLGVVLVYVLYYGVPKNVDDIFARFENTTTDLPRPDTGEGGPTVDVHEGDTDTARLRQLTTLPVAGAVFTDTGIRYAERGTGHIYEIDTESEEETLISGTTIPRTRTALFSQSGDQVILQNEEDGVELSHYGTFVTYGSEAALETKRLPLHSKDAQFADDGTSILFFVPHTEGGVGYRYSPQNDTTKTVFSIPLRDVRVLWGNPTFVYTTPSEKARGYLYRIGSKGLEYVTVGGRGLTAFSYASGTLVSTHEESGRVTRDSAYGDMPSFTLITEKCTRLPSQPHRVVCASPVGTSDVSIDAWYQGTTRTSDAIVLIDPKEGTVTTLSDLGNEVGRPIDVGMITARDDGKAFLFTNRYDGALWLFTP